MSDGSGFTYREQVVLIDGMSVLVRCAKAAARTAHLSHHGIPTGTLTLFINSVIKHLSAAEWDYAMIAWEGLPGRNWRRGIYPEYKSNRHYGYQQQPGDELPARALENTELEQARDFCDAAGIHQDWRPDFEGDDVIAAYWRSFRSLHPDAGIVIVTTDNDLFQLADEHTVCRSVSGSQEWGPEDIRNHFGCPPERFALLRSMAGDKSDGIPGIRGIGPVQAARLASAEGPPLDILRSLRNQYSAEEAAQASVYWMISELREPPTRPRDIGRDQCEHARWRPEYHAASLRDFLESYDMRRALQRLEASRLPWPPPAPSGQLAPGHEPDL